MLTRRWRQFVESYNRDPGYWQIPKGRAVIPENLGVFRQELEVIRKHFAGKTSWDFPAQVLFAEEMIDAGTYVERVPTDDNKAARARMEKVIFDLLGLAWVDEQSIMSLTPVGEALVAGSDPHVLVTRQVQKYQFSNPLDRQFPDFRTIPHAVLLRLLLRLHPRSLSVDEFSLFVARVRGVADLEQPRGVGLYGASTLEQISAYRRLSHSSKEELKHYIEAWRSPDSDNMWTRVRNDQGYILSFLTFPSYLELRDGAVGISDLALARAVDAFYQGEGTYIEFRTTGDWFAYYGETASMPSLETAYLYYEDVGEVRKAVEAYDSAKSRGKGDVAKSVEDYELERIKEAELEEWLANHLDRLQPGLRLYSEEGRLGRQFETPDAGTIDLLCLGDDTFVVVELKRSKASDQTFGQLSRYMGWVRRNRAAQRDVNGVIVAEVVDQKLDYSLDSLPGLRDRVRAVSYSDLGLSFDDLGYDPDGTRKVTLKVL